MLSSNIVDLPPNNKSGLYIAPLHTEGGVQVIVDGQKKIEVEGDEYHLSRLVLMNNKEYEFKNKTSLEILDYIFKDNKSIFTQGKAESSDYIICRLAVLDKTKHDFYGTAKDFVNLIQGEHGCKTTGNTDYTYAHRLGGSVSGKKDVGMELEKLLDKKLKLESRLHEAKLASNKVFANMGWGSGMRKSKISISTTKEDEIKGKLDVINKLISDIKGGSKKEATNDEINKIIRDLSTMKSGLKKHNESEYKSGYSKLLTLNENDVLSELENYIKFQKDNAKYFASKESKDNVDKWLEALIKLESDLKNDFEGVGEGVNSEKQELIDLIDLLKETLKSNPKDQDTKDSLELYEETLASFSDNKKEDKINDEYKNGGQVFNFFDYSYDIDKAYKLINSGTIIYEIKTIPVYEQRHRSINQDYADKLNVDYDSAQGLMIKLSNGNDLLIDGNHRMQKAFLNGAKEMKVFYISNPKTINKFAKKNTFEKGGNLTAEEAILNAPCINKNFKFVEAGDYSEYRKGGSINSMSESDLEKFYNTKEGKELDKETYSKWKSLVNMSKSELENFYNSEEGKEAGLSASEAKEKGIDSGRESARWIIKMKDIPYTEWTPDMWRWAKKQISFISRMSGMKGDLYDEKGNKTRKHTALLIWGHNPEKFEDGGSVNNSKINYYPTGYSVIDKIKEEAIPYIEELTNNYEPKFEEYFNKPFTDSDREEYELLLISDLIKALSKYIDKNDDVKDIKFSKSKGVISISATIIRDGQEYYFGTRMIIAEGYIQRRHYRYLIETKLPRVQFSTANDYVNNKIKALSKSKKIEQEINQFEGYITRMTSELLDSDKKTKQDVWNSSSYQNWKWNPESTKSQSEFEEWQKEEMEHQWTMHLRMKKSKENTVKDYAKKVEKLKLKLVELSEGKFENGGEIEDFDFSSLFNEESAEEKESREKQEEINEAQEKENWYQKSHFSKKWASTIKEAIDKTVKSYFDAKATYEDWSSRQYKSNKGVVYAGGDDIHGDIYTIGGINENRRQKTLRGAKMQMDEAIEDLKLLGLTKEEISELIDGKKFANGGKVEVNKVSVYQTDFSGLNFSDLGGYFESLATEVVDLEDENVMLKSLPVFLFFKNPYDIRSSEKIYIDDVIGAIIPKKMERDAKPILDKHFISYIAYVDDANNEDKIKAIKELAEINPDIILL